MLVRLTYASRSVRPVTNDELSSLVNVSKLNNFRLGITGILFYSGGVFLQQLEGERTQVNALYRRILADDMHREVSVVEMVDIPHRYFKNWSMELWAEAAEHRLIFLKYSNSANFDPFSMSSATLRSVINEIAQDWRWLYKAAVSYMA